MSALERHLSSLALIYNRRTDTARTNNIHDIVSTAYSLLYEFVTYDTSVIYQLFVGVSHYNYSLCTIWCEPDICFVRFSCIKFVAISSLFTRSPITTVITDRRIAGQGGPGVQTPRPIRSGGRPPVNHANPNRKFRLPNYNTSSF